VIATTVITDSRDFVDDRPREVLLRSTKQRERRRVFLGIALGNIARLHGTGEMYYLLTRRISDAIHKFYPSFRDMDNFNFIPLKIVIIVARTNLSRQTFYTNFNI